MCLWQDIQNLGLFFIYFGRYSDFPLMCLKPGLLTQENSHVCGVSLSPSACLEEGEEQQHVAAGHFDGFDVNVCPGDYKL